MPKKILADRQQFIDCVNGNLLTVENGEITRFGDKATAAVKAASRGETVWLTVGGEIVSKLTDGREIAIKTVYVEEE